jgi:hypothetical protein
MKMEREEKSEDDAREEKIEGDFLRLDGGCERQSQERRKTTKRGVGRLLRPFVFGSVVLALACGRTVN